MGAQIKKLFPGKKTDTSAMAHGSTKLIQTFPSYIHCMRYNISCKFY